MAQLFNASRRVSWTLTGWQGRGAAFPCL